MGVKAWIVGADYEGRQEVVFHAHSVGARRIGADRFCGEFETVECQRAPEFDQYADRGFVPVEVLLKNGWSHECERCGTPVYDEEADFPDLVFVSNRVFCSADCYREKILQRRRVDLEFNRFQLDAPFNIPSFARIERFEGGWPNLGSSADLSFPGQKHRATLRRPNGEWEFWVAHGDRKTWEELSEGKEE